jgi:hypothetical protein
MDKGNDHGITRNTASCEPVDHPVHVRTSAPGNLLSAALVVQACTSRRRRKNCTMGPFSKPGHRI